MTIPKNSRLPDTRDTHISHAVDPNIHPDKRDLTLFCQHYWFPIYANIRRRGYSKEKAEDLTLSFFEKIHDPEKNPLVRFDKEKGRERTSGSFRTFILWKISGHLSDARCAEKALKRGGDASIVSFDVEEADQRYQDVGKENLDPSQLFERLLALEILEKAEAELQFQYEQAGQVALFDALKPHLYQPDPDESYPQLGNRLSMTKSQIQKALEKMRGSNRLILRKQVANLCLDPAVLDQEMKALQKAL